MPTERYTKQLEKSREWKKRNKDRHAELARAYRKRNKHKTRAQNALNYAIRKGDISRAPCEKCGTDHRVHAHHADYGKPLEVRWLCYLCHKNAHPVSDEDKKIKFAFAVKAKLFGDENPNAVLSSEHVSQIRSALNAGISQDRIARAFGVSQVSISRIKLGRQRVNDK